MKWNQRSQAPVLYCPCTELFALLGADGKHFPKGQVGADCLVGLCASSKCLSVQRGGGLRTAAALLCKQVEDTLL